MFSQSISSKRFSTISASSIQIIEYPEMLQKYDAKDAGRNEKSDLSKADSKTAKGTTRAIKATESDKTLLDFLDSPTIPHFSKIHPKDIILIAAIGDSLLTGLGVTKHEEKLKNRIISKLSPLLSWTISGEHRQNNCITGGGKKVISVARLIRCFGNVKMNCKKTVFGSRGDGYNFARTGAKSSTLATQSIRLLKKIKHTKGWKLVFIWIGANDIFSMSLMKIQNEFRKNVLQAIEILRNHTDNIVLVILPVPYLDHLCKSMEKQNEIGIRVSIVNSILKDIVSTYKSLQNLTFRIRFEPIPLEARLEMISSLDRVHPSIKANEVVCKAVWNNLFREEEGKLVRFEQVVEAPWFEPGEEDYLKF
jgi:lysophospholipase L1-like esterase